MCSPHPCTPSWPPRLMSVPISLLSSTLSATRLHAHQRACLTVSSASTLLSAMPPATPPIIRISLPSTAVANPPREVGSAVLGVCQVHVEPAYQERLSLHVNEWRVIGFPCVGDVRETFAASIPRMSWCAVPGANVFTYSDKPYNPAAGAAEAVTSRALCH
jgi:hypothetical protein